MRGIMHRFGGPWRQRRTGRMVALCAVVVLAQTAAAWGVKPNSPEVKKLIANGVKYLETAEDGRLGAQALIAMTLLKAGEPASHPKVQATLKACQAQLAQPAENFREEFYSVGMVVMFLCELDPVEYAKEIRFFMSMVLDRQKDHGGWGYENQPTGDTSMTQYGVLAAWTAQQAGFPMPIEMTEKVANWLIRTQDPTGGWGYQGIDPGNFSLVAQTEVKLSLTTAALGSCLIAANLLGFIDMRSDADEADLPPALKLVVEQDNKNAGAANANVEIKRLRTATTSGAAWFRRNFKIDPPGFTHYYLYALERYMSFVELVEGVRAEEPAWYNAGYQFLAKTQQENGSWASASGAPADTAFGVLFLLRSTRKAIEKTKSFGQGSLVGGRGLPSNTSKVKLRGGQLVAANQARAIEDVIKALGDADDEELGALTEAPVEITLSADVGQRDSQLRNLRQVVRSGNPKARLAAVRTLGISREVSCVPLLIYALSDPDPQVAIAADRALRISSRRLDAEPLKLPLDENSRAAAQERWTKWYRKLYPDLAIE
jgi:hypothetical protein